MFHTCRPWSKVASHWPARPVSRNASRTAAPPTPPDRSTPRPVDPPAAPARSAPALPRAAAPTAECEPSAHCAPTSDPPHPARSRPSPRSPPSPQSPTPPPTRRKPAPPDRFRHQPPECAARRPAAYPLARPSCRYGVWRGWPRRRQLSPVAGRCLVVRLCCRKQPGRGRFRRQPPGSAARRPVVYLPARPSCRYGVWRGWPRWRQLSSVVGRCAGCLAVRLCCREQRGCGRFWWGSGLLGVGRRAGCPGGLLPCRRRRWFRWGLIGLGGGWRARGPDVRRGDGRLGFHWGRAWVSPGISVAGGPGRGPVPSTTSGRSGSRCRRCAGGPGCG